jgi:UDP-4-keto-D-QuiNAc 4-reductase
MTILVTGANGFVGSKLVETLAERGNQVVACTRAIPVAQPESAAINIRLCSVGALSSETDWTGALDGVNVVIHCAAKVHDMRDTDNYDLFQAVNVDGTMALARQAEQAGVKRFLFLSTLKVHGEASPAGRPFVEDDHPAPTDAYSQSKYDAEIALRALARTSSMELVIVRPPLVYGPGVKANFRSLMNAVNRSLPLPFAGITGNRRSLVSIYNLVDFLICVAQHPDAANEAFLINDDEDLSTAQLLRKIAEALDKRLYAVRVPPSMLLAAAKLLGKQQAMQRLTSDLVVDISKSKQLLGWRPIASCAWALKQTAAHFLSQH